MRTIRRSAGLALLAVLASGCDEELGPVPMPVARVRGVVRQGDRTVGGGWIEFTPVEGAIGKFRSTRLGTDGSFVADGVAVGINQVRFVNARLGASPLRGIFAASNSPIRRKVEADGSSTIEIDLFTESIRFRDLLERVKSGTARGGRP